MPAAYFSSDARNLLLPPRSWFRASRLAGLDGLPIFVAQGAAQVAEFSGTLQKFSSIHADDLSIDVAGAVAYQKCRQIGQLFDRAEAVQRVAIESELFEVRTGQDSGEGSLRGNGTGGNRVHANAAIAPLDGEAASESFDAGFRDGGGDNVSRTRRRVGCGYAEYSSMVASSDPAASAGHGCMERAHEHDADYRIECAGGKILGAGDEVSGSVVDQYIERGLFPDRVDHGFDGVEIAHVARKGLNCASGGGGEFGCGLFEHGFAAAADVDSCTEFEEALSHAFAQARSSPGDEDAFAVEKILLEHECSVPVRLANERSRDCSDDFKLPLELRSILYECLPHSSARWECFPEMKSEDIAGDAEAVIGVLEFGRHAGTGGAARDLDLMAPGTSAGGLALAELEAAWIALGRHRIIVGIVPVAAPLVDIVANIVEAEKVGGVTGDWLWAVLPASGIIGTRLRRLVAPGELFLFFVASGGALPLGFGGQTVRVAGLSSQPLAILCAMKPGNAGHRLIGMIEIRIVPEGWRRSGGRAEEQFILRVRDLCGCQQEGIDPDTVDGTFAVLTGVAAHQEPAFGDGDQRWF